MWIRYIHIILLIVQVDVGSGRGEKRLVKFIGSFFFFRGKKREENTRAKNFNVESTIKIGN